MGCRVVVLFAGHNDWSMCLTTSFVEKQERSSPIHLKKVRLFLCILCTRNGVKQFTLLEYLGETLAMK